MEQNCTLHAIHGSSTDTHVPYYMGKLDPMMSVPQKKQIMRQTKKFLQASDLFLIPKVFRVDLIL